MLTGEENELLTRVGPGTPCGELLRRYWHPICVASELTAERPKKRIKLLGEDLVLYRDPNGGYGLLGEHCSHRGASLYYGFLEDRGIRCPYHGWLYDETGRCLEQPFEPAQSMMKHAIRHPAYPVQKLAGLVFAYLGPEPAPLLPRWDVLVWEDGRRKISRQETLNCNWLQGEENSADVTHTWFLHAHAHRVRGMEGGDYFGRPFEEYGFQPFEWGLLKTWRYAGDGRQYGPEQGGGNPLVFPNLLRQQSGPAHNIHWRVPIDDTHTQIFVVTLVKNREGRREEQPEDPEVEDMPAQVLPNGEYAMDGFFSQDKMAWETQGPIFDRGREHLGASDRGIVLFREMLRAAIEAVQRREDPRGVIRDPAANEIIELPSWFVEKDGRLVVARGALRSEGGSQGWDLAPADELLDDRHETFEVPFGAARPAR